MKIRARLARGGPDYEAAAILRKGLGEMDDFGEGLFIEVGDEQEEYVDEEPEALIDAFSKGFDGRETESPSKRMRPSPSGNGSDFDSRTASR